MATGAICRCGAAISDRATSCPRCGASLRQANDNPADGSALEIREFLPDRPTRGEKPAASPVAEPPRVGRRMLEALVDPRAIEWMLLIGGALSIVGLIVWLVSVGAFENPLNKAIGFGIGTGVLLGAGWWLTLRTRYRMAGEALTFLACVVAPLNIWFYHGQDLLSVDGHLWIAGIVCCGLYAATLIVLKRPLFIFACQAGVTLTTLLFLADFGTLGATSVAATLAILGAISVHLEPGLPSAGTFDRRRFGRPLVWGGLGLFVAGLFVMLPAQIWGWTHLPASALSWLINPDLLAISPVVGTVIWMVGGYLALYVALVPRLAGGWTSLASIACLLMAETTALIGLEASAEGVIVALSLTSAAACLVLARLARGKASRVIQVARIGVVALAALPVGLGYLLLARGTMPSFEIWGWQRNLTTAFPIAMALATACQVAGVLAMREFRRDALVLRFLAAGAAVLTTAGIVWQSDIPDTIRLAALVAVPLGYLVSGIVRKDEGDVVIAHTLSGVFGASLFLAVCHQGLDLFIPAEAKLATLGTAIVMLEASILLLLSAGHLEARGRGNAGICLSLTAVATTAGVIWQGAVYAGYWDDHAVSLLVGGGLLITLLHFVAKVSRPARIVGTGLMLLTAVAVNLQGLGYVLNDAFIWKAVTDLLVVAGGCAIAAVIVPAGNWRRLLAAAGGVSLAVAMLMFLSRIELSKWQLVEILSVSAGVVLLVAGHVGRFRETGEQPDDLVDAGLWVGALLVMLPLSVATFMGRFIETAPRIYDEFALVTFAVLMLATGLGWRFKATTLLGGVGLVGYLVVLLAAVLRRPEVTMGAYLAGIGAALFTIGVLLSIYREYLLSLPDRIAQRKGLFQVLDWR